MRQDLLDRWNASTTREEHKKALAAIKKEYNGTTALIIATVLAGMALLMIGCKQSPDDYTYPRRAVQVAQMSNWIERAGALCFTDYSMIVTSSPPSQIDAMLEGARQAGAKEWASNVTICYKTGLRDVKTYASEPPGWVYNLARYSPEWAHVVAVYENRIRGCDWLIRDQYGGPIPIYSASHMLTDWSPYCPRGLWDGVVRDGKSTFSIGDTRGLTIYEWLAGPMRDSVVLSERFQGTYDVFCLDDDPFVGSPSWHVPNRTRYQLSGQGRNVSRQQYDDLCRPAVKLWHAGFAGALNRKFVMLAQNYGLKPSMDPLFAEDVHVNYNGAILPSYGFCGCWPQGDILLGWAQWPRIDEAFTPYSSGIHWQIDALQGVNVCFTECLVRREWPAEQQRQLARESLAHTLMYDAYFHCAYKDDESGWKYVKGESELFTFPEMQFDLGKARTECIEHNNPAYPGKPLFYRYFQNDKHQYTVVINMHEVDVQGIPARDAKWFEGLWPRLHSGEVKL